MKPLSHISLVTTILLSMTLIGCSEPHSETAAPAEPADEWTLITDPLYSVWVTAYQVSGFELSERLRQGSKVADQLCESDTNKPQNYVQHLALVSTPERSRVDLLELYKLDAESIVRWADTNQVFTKNLGTFLYQIGEVNPGNRAGVDLIKLTFSEKGQFSGYCESESAFMPTIYTPHEGEMKQYATACDQPGVLVCLSIR